MGMWRSEDNSHLSVSHQDGDKELGSWGKWHYLNRCRTNMGYRMGCSCQRTETWTQHPIPSTGPYSACTHRVFPGRAVLALYCALAFCLFFHQLAADVLDPVTSSFLYLHNIRLTVPCLLEPSSQFLQCPAESGLPPC